MENYIRKIRESTEKESSGYLWVSALFLLVCLYLFWMDQCVRIGVGLNTHVLLDPDTVSFYFGAVGVIAAVLGMLSRVGAWFLRTLER
jgi:hypothetical protein